MAVNVKAINVKQTQVSTVSFIMSAEIICESPFLVSGEVAEFLTRLDKLSAPSYSCDGHAQSCMQIVALSIGSCCQPEKDELISE